MMTIDTSDIVAIIAVGFGATLFMDLWAIWQKRAFNVTLPNYCLVGRWLRYMPAGTFKHSSIISAPSKPAECTIGWIAHYAIGVIFAFVLVLVFPRWLGQPTILPALILGIVTVVVPLFVMQPAFGFGIAAAKTPNPGKARLRSCITHTVFGVGLYISGLALSLFLNADT